MHPAFKGSLPHSDPEGRQGSLSNRHQCFSRKPRFGSVFVYTDLDPGPNRKWILIRDTARKVRNFLFWQTIFVLVTKITLYWYVTVQELYKTVISHTISKRMRRRLNLRNFLRLWVKEFPKYRQLFRIPVDPGTSGKRKISASESKSFFETFQSFSNLISSADFFNLEELNKIDEKTKINDQGAISIC